MPVPVPTPTPLPPVQTPPIDKPPNPQWVPQPPVTEPPAGPEESPVLDPPPLQRYGVREGQAQSELPCQIA
jgi:hypothetical protein